MRSLLTDGIGLIVGRELLEISRWGRSFSDERDANLEFLTSFDGCGVGQRRSKIEKGRSDNGALHGRRPEGLYYDPYERMVLVLYFGYYLAVLE